MPSKADGVISGPYRRHKADGTTMDPVPGALFDYMIRIKDLLTLCVSGIEVNEFDPSPRAVGLLATG